MRKRRRHRYGRRSILRRPDHFLHVLLHFFGQLFHLLCLLDHIERKHVLVRLVHRRFQFRRQLKQLVGVVLDVLLSFLVGLFEHAVLHLFLKTVLLGLILRRRFDRRRRRSRRCARRTKSNGSAHEHGQPCRQKDFRWHTDLFLY